MYPTLVKFGAFEITTSGLMMFLGFIVGGWILTRNLRRHGMDDDLASSIVMAAALGGILGAFTVAQLISVIAVIIGAFIMARARAGATEPRALRTEP